MEMLKLYCQSCGGVNIYSSEKPNFCQKCGDPTNGEKKTNKKAKAKVKKVIAPKKRIVEEVEEVEVEEEPTTLYQNMTEIDFDFDFSQREPDTFGSIAGTSEGSSLDPVVNPDKPKLTDKEIHEKFKEEAGSLRRSPNKEQEAQ